MVEVLVARMLRDDCKSSWAHPYPQVILEGLCLVEGPYQSASHFSEAVTGVHIIGVLRIQVAKVMCQEFRAGTWEAGWRVLHVFISNYVPALLVDDHFVFVHCPCMDLVRGVSIPALVVDNFDPIVLCDGSFTVPTAVIITSCPSMGVSWYTRFARRCRRRLGL